MLYDQEGRIFVMDAFVSKSEMGDTSWCFKWDFFPLKVIILIENNIVVILLASNRSYVTWSYKFYNMTLATE